MLDKWRVLAVSLAILGNALAFYGGYLYRGAEVDKIAKLTLQCLDGWDKEQQARAQCLSTLAVCAGDRTFYDNSTGTSN